MKTAEFTFKMIIPKDVNPLDVLPRVSSNLGILFGSQDVRLSDSESVKNFQEKFNVPIAATPEMLSPSTAEYRIKFMNEELTEFVDSQAQGDLHGAADALIDLAYVVHGTALMMGLPWAALWSEVQRANMSKVRATDASQSKRGSALDVVKPEGWVGPDFTMWLGEKC